MKKRTVMLGFFVILLLAILFIIMCSNSQTLSTTEYILESEKIDDEFTIVQISDLHNDERYIDVISEKISELSPNCVVITGDFIDYYEPQIDVSMKLIEKIQNISPIYFIQGNHEQFSNHYNELKEQLSERNVIILENNFVEEDNINIVGLLNGSETLIETNNNKFTLLLAHRPELFENYCKMNPDLILSGHTHGGQICLPIIGGIYAPNQGLFPKYVAGKYTQDNITMIISRGIGNGKIPFRILSNPELVIIKIQ